MSDSLWPCGLQHTRLPCPSLSHKACANSCPLIRWCHPTIASSAAPFFSCPQSFPASGSFPMIWLFASGGQNIGASASAPVLLMNIQGWFPLGWTGLIFLQSKGLSRVFSNTTVQKHQFFSTQLSLTIWTLLANKCLCFLIYYLGLSRFVTVFFPRSKHLLISWLQSPAVILQPKRIKSLTISIVSPSICCGIGCHDLCFLNIEL